MSSFGQSVTFFIVGFLPTVFFCSNIFFGKNYHFLLSPSQKSFSTKKKNLSLSGHDLNNGNKFLKFFQSIHCQVLFNSLVDSVMKPGIFSNNSLMNLMNELIMK